MNAISVAVSLNRSTLQFDDACVCALETYLAESASLLEGDPDPQEILSDLEQAVARPVHAAPAPWPSRRDAGGAGAALEEIGSVQTPTASVAPEQATRPTSRPLQQISEGAVISGVCQGLARYFGLNVTALRIFAVLLLLLSGGGVILVYQWLHEVGQVGQQQRNWSLARRHRPGWRSTASRITQSALACMLPPGTPSRSQEFRGPITVDDQASQALRDPLAHRGTEGFTTGPEFLHPIFRVPRSASSASSAATVGLGRDDGRSEAVELLHQRRHRLGNREALHRLPSHGFRWRHRCIDT